MNRIYYNNRILFLTDNLSDINANDKIVWQKYSNQDELKQFIDTFIQIDEIKNFGVFHHQLKDLISAVKKCFNVIEASGGLIVNSSEELLFIHRLGVWDLPKGKMDKNETPEETALREINEECGLSELTISHKIIDTYHIYLQKGEYILKCTHWFKIISNDKKAPVPQLSENIIDVKWIKTEQTEQILLNTYPSVREVVYTELNYHS